MKTSHEGRFTVTAGGVATGLLLAMVGVYVVSRIYEPAVPALGFLVAFSEAAMVGALADWFAVTALFRRPLGLPIRHTEIIPRNKDRIGDALGNFVENNFLSPEMVASRIATVDFAAVLTNWMTQPDNAAVVARRIVACLPPVLEAVRDEDVQRFIHESVTLRLREFEIAPLTGEILGLLTAEGRHRPLIDDVLRQLGILLREHEAEIRERVRSNTAWLWRRLSIDEKVSDQIIAAAENTLVEIGADPSHPWRIRFDRTVEEFVEELRTSEAYRLQGEEIKERLLQHPALHEYLSGLWSQIRHGIIEDAESEDSVIRGRLLEVSRLIAAGLARDAAMRERLNRWVRDAIIAVVRSQRHEIAGLISATVRKWDAATMAQKIEAQIGDDLQFIRINGTLIGGAVGVVLHGISVLAL